MKKILSNKKLLIGIIAFIVVIVIIVLVIFLFGSKKTVCTMTSNQTKSGYTMDTKYVIKSSRGIVSSVVINEKIVSKKKTTLEKFYKQLDDQYGYNKKTYGGYTYKVTNEDGVVTSHVTINYKEFDMEKFIENNQAMKAFTKNNQFTLEGAISLYESTGATCK